MVEMIKTDVDGLLLVLIMKQIFRYIFLKFNLFFIFEAKSSLSISVLIFSTISQILKSKFYVLWTQTCKILKSIIFTDFRSITCP